MTNQKFNKVRKNSYLNAKAFEKFFDKAEQCLVLDNFTAEQIAAIVDLCYSCYCEGYKVCDEDYMCKSM